MKLGAFDQFTGSKDFFLARLLKVKDCPVAKKEAVFGSAGDPAGRC